jgi:hypothetical protein
MGIASVNDNHYRALFCLLYPFGIGASKFLIIKLAPHEYNNFAFFFNNV